MNIPRALKAVVEDKIKHSNKGVVIYGPRQAGKTTLVTDSIRSLGLRALTVNGDQTRYIDILTSRDAEKMKSLVAGYDMLFVDEAQRIPEIGINLKIILDEIPSVRLIVTGSSSLDLASKIAKPLTGRMWVYRLYTIACMELSGLFNTAQLDATLEERLVYGSYPEVFSIVAREQKREYLEDLCDAYLYKDLLMFGGIANSSKIRDLLRVLAFQIGSQVSLTEVSTTIGMGKDTVARYIDLLEKSFVIFRLHGLHRNLRKEVSKMDKIFFYDLGVRNTLIGNMHGIQDRNDIGQLWENFCIIERMKYLAYTKQYASWYFWRTHTGAELDYVEDRGGKLHGFEMKWGMGKAKAPVAWQTTYPDASWSFVNRSNYLPFMLPHASGR